MKMKTRYLALFLVGMFVCALSACALLDGWTGTNPATGESTGGIVGAVGTLATPWLPWAGAAAGWLTSLYAALRGRSWKKAATVTFAGLEEFLKTPEGAALETRLKEWLAAKHDAAGVYDLVKSMVAKFDH